MLLIYSTLLVHFRGNVLQVYLHWNPPKTYIILADVQAAEVLLPLIQSLQ